jgi:hypothetical protein
METHRYYYRKNTITAAFLAALLLVFIVLSVVLGYYWNAVQGLLSGIDSPTHIVERGSIFGNLLIVICVCVPMILLAMLGARYKKISDDPVWRLVLFFPFAVYVISLVINIVRVFPLSEAFADVYAVAENAVYIPTILAEIFMAAYLVLVIAQPAGLAARIVAVFAMIFNTIYFIANGVLIVFSQAMSLLGGEFGIQKFGFLLFTFALDIITYFLMMSLLMSFCAMKREDAEPADEPDAEQTT